MNELVMHVGLMKSGTTYLQEILSRNREFLRASAWDYPGARLNQQHACYSLCGSDIPWVKKPFPEKLGHDLVKKLKRADTSILISAEALSVLHEDGIQRFLEQTRVPTKVVFTLRSLDRTLPSAWQQYLKGGGRTTFRAFIQRLQEQRADMSGFWRTYGFGHAIERWSRIAPVAVVIMPKAGGSREVLWELFRTAANLPQVPELEVAEEDSNVSLSLQAAQILREINKALPKKSERSDQLRNQYLKSAAFPNVGKLPGGRIEIPRQCLAQVEDWNSEEIGLAQSSCSVVEGSWEDLELSEPDTDVTKPGVKPTMIAKTAALHLISLLEKDG